jgi:hypothetical protein
VACVHIIRTSILTQYSKKQIVERKKGGKDEDMQEITSKLISVFFLFIKKIKAHIILNT